MRVESPPKKLNKEAIYRHHAISEEKKATERSPTRSSKRDKTINESLQEKNAEINNNRIYSYVNGLSKKYDNPVLFRKAFSQALELIQMEGKNKYAEFLSPETLKTFDRYLAENKERSHELDEKTFWQVDLATPPVILGRDELKYSLNYYSSEEPEIAQYIRDTFETPSVRDAFALGLTLSLIDNEILRKRSETTAEEMSANIPVRLSA